MPARHDEAIRARRPGRRRGRKPKTVDEERTCATPGCTTKLNRYNRADRCSLHRKTRFPRVRGRTR